MIQPSNNRRACAQGAEKSCGSLGSLAQIANAPPACDGRRVLTGRPNDQENG